jgi:hypothetical protein
MTGFVLIVKRRLPHIEQKLPTSPENPSSPQFFYGVSFAPSLDFCVVLCSSSFNLFLLAIAMSVRFTASDYPIGILDLRRLITHLVS